MRSFGDPRTKDIRYSKWARWRLPPTLCVYIRLKNTLTRPSIKIKGTLRPVNHSSQTVSTGLKHGLHQGELLVLLSELGDHLWKDFAANCVRHSGKSDWFSPHLASSHVFPCYKWLPINFNRHWCSIWMTFVHRWNYLINIWHISACEFVINIHVHKLDYLPLRLNRHVCELV